MFWEVLQGNFTKSIELGEGSFDTFKLIFMRIGNDKSWADTLRNSPGLKSPVELPENRGTSSRIIAASRFPKHLVCVSNGKIRAEREDADRRMSVDDPREGRSYERRSRKTDNRRPAYRTTEYPQ